MNKVIEAFTSFCPDLHPKIPKGRKSAQKQSLISNALNNIKWGSLNNEIYDGQETCGDLFYYVYFEEKDVENRSSSDKKIYPRLKRLDSDKMVKIVLDDAGNPRAYIYKHTVFDEKINYLTGDIIKENEREEILIFEKGQCHKIEEGKDSTGNLILDDNGDIKVNKKTIKNLEGLEDIIPIIHIYSDKRQGEEFSVIPADSYIDLCLTIDQIVSDMRAINRNSGFPRPTLLDCEYVAGDGRIGGAKLARTVSKREDDEFDLNSPRQGQIFDQQIKNGLDSYFSELRFHLDNLYDMVGITNPTLMQRVSSSDSSKMYNQVNMRMEQKIEKYIDNIIEGFKPFFKILLLVNGLYKESEDFGYSFSKPQSIIKNSAYDELLIKQLELNTGIKTLYDILKEKEYTDDEVEEHFNRINEEVRNGKNDIRINKEDKKEETVNESIRNS